MAVTSGIDYQVWIYDPVTKRGGWSNCTRIGGDLSTNYIAIGTDGDVKLLGTSRAWEDLRIEPIARTTGNNAPTFEKWIDDVNHTTRGVYLYSFDDAASGSEKEIHFTMQIPHNAVVGGILRIHVHWIGAVNDTTSTPRWGLEYTFAEPSSVFGSSQIIYAEGNTESDPDTTVLHHYITQFADITPDSTQDGLSAILIGRLFRNSANAKDTYNANGAKCGLLYIDAHYQVDSFGSNDEYTK
jgi:hypothetical protein